MANIPMIYVNSIYRERVNALSKIYTWSVVLEPLLFFIVSIPGTSNAVSNLSRGLQLIVFIMLVFKLILNSGTIRIPNIFDFGNRIYTYYFIFAIIAGCYGYISGAYDLSDGRVTTSYRSFFEYIIALYYFIYFVILPGYFLKNPNALDYFFKVFSIVFFLFLFVGFLELILIKLDFGFKGIPRHISDGRNVGVRFHAFAGEPRDAFVYLMLGLSMLALRDLWKNEKKLIIFRIIIIILAALITQSASGLIGWVFASILMLIFFIPKLPVKKIVPVISILIFILSITVLGALGSSRIMIYYDAFRELYPILESGDEVSSILKNTTNNIYPIWHRWLEMLDFKVLPLFFGTGFGSASIVNNNYLNNNELLNPNSNIIRTIYETGVIGTFLFISAFLVPLKKIHISKKERLKIVFLMLLLMGAFFAHRSVAPFIFLGITLLIFKKKLIVLDNKLNHIKSIKE